MQSLPPKFAAAGARRRHGAADGVKSGGLDGVTVVDEEVSEMVGEALDAYQAECGGKVKVRRLLALSSFPDMHSDMCICAEDAMAALILMPFHKTQCMDGGHLGFRLVNQKVLQLAPCSVGRGSSWTPASASSSVQITRRRWWRC